jgi:very-short-patch-repair endonuclease
MDLIHPIREALVPVLTVGSWDAIEEDHARVKLPWREDLKPGWGKPKYVKAVLVKIDDATLLDVARRCIDAFPDRAAITVQNALWNHEAGGKISLTVITRRALAAWLDGRRLDPGEDPTTFIGRFGIAALQPFDVSYGASGRLRGALEPFEDARVLTHQELLTAYGFEWWPDRRVFQFLEALVDPAIRRAAEQAEWRSGLNEIVAADGFELREVDQVSGHPKYAVTLRPKGKSHGRPKNLIFASSGPKPEIGFTDVINGDIAIVRNGEHCLQFDDPLTDNGLTWEELVVWWTRTTGGDQKGLYERLKASTASPPERAFLHRYYKLYLKQLGPRLPALLPQVYLHYDPATFRQLKERGLEGHFLVQRMDFLMLLPNGVRIVLEIDGQQHYSTGTGKDAKPSPKVYALTAQSDRELRLVGYEVYRFAGVELGDANAEATTKAFFDVLFRRHSIS